jgi:tetratricopeptide (TPR) repeat protein
LSQQRFTEAVDAAERARAADARWVNAIITVARAHRAAGRHDRAIGELRKALQTNPDASNVQFQLGATYVLMGDTTAGVAELEKLVDRRGSNLRFVSYLAYAYAMDGRMRQSREILRELRRLRELQYVSYFGIAMIHDALDEKDDARVALDRAFLEHAVEFTMLDTYPRFNALVAHPRYQQLLRH